LWAMFFAATNVSVAYYGRTSNLDGPALFWTVLAIERLLDDRDGRGGPRDLAWAAAFAAAAVATKDQAYASFLLVVPAALLVRRRRGVAAAIGVGARVYAVLGGAALNPPGFAARVATLIGPASEDYRAYAPSLAGRLANLGDLAAAQGAMFWSWPVVALAAAGIARSARSLRACLPLLAGLGSVVGFPLVVGRS